MFITGLTSSAKLYSHPLKNNVIIEIHKNHAPGSHVSPIKGPYLYLLVKKVIVHLYLWIGFEVIWHQHNRDLNMAQFIDLEKYKINGTGYYYLCGKCFTWTQGSGRKPGRPKNVPLTFLLLWCQPVSLEALLTLSSGFATASTSLLAPTPTAHLGGGRLGGSDKGGILKGEPSWPAVPASLICPPTSPPEPQPRALSDIDICWINEGNHFFKRLGTQKATWSFMWSLPFLQELYLKISFGAGYEFTRRAAFMKEGKETYSPGV